MAKAKKLPSGMWNVSVYSHMEGNKRKYVSFTAPTKAAVELKAAEYKANKKRLTYTDLTVIQAVDGYISAKEAVLSPATIRGYTNTRKHFDGIANKKIRSLSSEEVQIFISNLSTRGMAPKSVRNVYGLLTASIALYCPDLYFRVSLPAKKKTRPSSPSDEAVAALYEHATGNLKKAIAFGCLGLRVGEICALTYNDVDGNTIHISKDMVLDKDGNWIIKDVPKTEDSDRSIKLPGYLVELIGTGSGRIVPVYPNTICKRFIMLRNKLGISIRFHDLRHYFASTAAVLNVPDLYVADMGGWSRAGNAPVMKSVYQNNIRSMSDYYADKMADHMQKVFKA